MAKRDRISSGLSIKDITGMNMQQFESYTPKQQREIVSRLASAANKRLRKLEQKDIITPARIRLEGSGGKISVKGKEGTALKEELFRAKQFLKSSLSTVTGYKKLEKELEAEQKRFSQVGEMERERSKEVMGLAFSYYDVLAELDPDIAKIRDKYKIAEHIADEIEKGTDYDKIISSTMDYLQKEYEKNQSEYERERERFGNRVDNDIPLRYRR